MKFASAALLFLLSTLSAVCREQSPSNSAAGDKVALNTPAPGDPEYIAEDPRLAQLVGQPGPAIKLRS